MGGPAPNWVPSTAQLERYLGGAHKLRQLADPNRSGQADPLIVQEWIDAAKGLVRARALIKHDAETLDRLDVDSAQILLNITLGVAARNAYVRGAEGQAMPPRLQAMVDEELRNLVELAEARLRLSRAAGQPGSAINQFAGVVDYDPQGQGRSIAGLKRGGFL